MALTKSDLASNQQEAVSGLQLDSFASDKISEVAGLKDLNANLDGEATIQAASTAKSTAVSTGVTDKVASLAEIGSNAGLTSSVSTVPIGPTSVVLASGTYTATGHNLSVGDAVTVGGSTYYVQDVPSTSTFKLSADLGGPALTTNAPAATAADWASATYQHGGINDFDVASNSTINNSSASTLSATANTTNGAAASVADLGHAAGIENLLDLDVGGNLTMQGKSSAGISASSETVTGEAAATSTLSGSQVGIETTGLADIKADASIQGITQLTNTATAATFNSAGATGKTDLAGISGADALANAGNIQGASLEDLNIGGSGNVLGQAGLTNNATASNVEGAAIAFSKQGDGADGTPAGFMEGLDLQGAMNVKSDAGINGVANLTGNAVANTTKGTATADAEANILKGADLTGGTVDVGGIGDLKGSLNFNLAAVASNVDNGIAQATDSTTSIVSADAQANQGIGLAGKGVSSTNPQTDSGNNTGIGIDIASDGTLSGLNIGSLKATATSTADNAKATAGTGDQATGAQLPSVDIGGIGKITAGAQLNSTAIAESVGGISIAEAGKDGSVTGLNAVGETPDGFTTPSEALYTLNDFNINVASDATIGAQAFSNLNATATSTAGFARAEAGGSTTNGSGVASPGNSVTGIAAGMDINVGGIGNLTALAQGTANATANSVTDDADALGAMRAIGINELEMHTSSDANLKSTASLVGNAAATTTGDSVADDTAWAGLDLDSSAVKGLALDVGGIGNLTGNASVTGKATSEVVTGNADTRVDIDAMGIDNAWIHTASDGNITGTGILNLDVSAASTAGSAMAEGDFDATGAQKLYIGNTEFTGTSDDFVGIGGIANLKGQAQVTANMNANSVSGTADAYSGVDLADGGTMNFTANASRIVGLDNVDLRGASDGTILGTAKGTFSTNASTTGDAGNDNANAYAAQSLLGINDLNLNLGGAGQINAIVNDTNFVGAHSVSGNATALSTLDAIGLAGGDMHIAGNASIMSTVGVDSKSESHTIA